MKKYRLFILAVFYIGFLQPLAASNLSNTSFSYLSTENGLSQKTVKSIYQDNNGFLWIGTQEGLNRYDGIKIIVFKHSVKDNTSISNDVINDVIGDKSGNVWIATNDGLNRFLAANKTFEKIKIKNENGQKNLRINTLFISSDGIMWIGTSNSGIYLLDTNSEKLIAEKFSNVKDLEKADIRAIMVDSRGRKWIGTNATGLYVLSDNQIVNYISSEKNNKSISHNQIRSITEDHKGRIWIGTRGGGLNRFDEITKVFKKYQSNPESKNSLTHNRVYSIYEDNKQTLWVATDEGISVYNPQNDDFYQIKNKPSQKKSLSHNRVLTIYQDESNIIWFGTLSGLNQWNPNLADFEHYRNIAEDDSTLTNNTVTSFAENVAEDKVYIATFGGLNIYEDKFNRVGPVVNKKNEKISNKKLTSLLLDKKKRLWVGSISNGIDVFSSELKKIAHYEKPKITSNAITSIVQAADDNVWIATYGGGINLLEAGSETAVDFDFIHSKYKISRNVFQLIEDDEGYIWGATDGTGIFRLDKITKTALQIKHEINNQNSLSGDIVWSIFQDSRGRFWIGTQGNGLNMWEPEDRRRGINKFKHYSIENGLNSSTINAIREDSSGNIWISTNRGVSRINTKKEEIKHFNLTDGIHYNELNQGAILMSEKEKLYFGGSNGVSAFLPKKAKKNSYIPPIVLTEIMSGNKSISFDTPINKLEEINFTHEDYLVTFEFAALDYTQPEKNQYQYKLEGLDSDWINVANLNRATFTNLPSGNYILKVKGSNNDGVWSEASINLKINVLPAPWLSWWAYSIYMCLFIITLIIIIRFQARRLANQEMFRSMVAEQVAEKTTLHLKNNDFLKEQMDKLKLNSNVDLETGLPNQKYLCDLVKANYQWINQFNDLTKDNSPKLCLALIKLPFKPRNNSADELSVINKSINKVDDYINTLDLEYKVTVRWGHNEIGIVIYCDNENECERYMKLISLKINTIFQMEISNNLRLKTSYIVSPLSGVNQGLIDSTNVIMLAEHMLHVISGESNTDLVGITGANQKITPAKFKQILKSNRVSELTDFFDFTF